MTTTYVWDGDKLVYEVVGNTKVSYTHGLDLIAREEGSTTSFYLYDGHGNVAAVTNDSGTVTQTYQYDAFGNQLNANPADT